MKAYSTPPIRMLGLMIAFAVSASTLTAQEGGFKLFLSSNPKEAAKGAATGTTSSIAVRPNQESTFYVYVTNGTGQLVKEKATVRLTRDAKGDDILASGTLNGLADGVTQLVVLQAPAQAKTDAAPAAAPTGAADAGKSADAAATVKPLPGTAVREALFLHIRDAEGREYPRTSAVPVPVSLLNPAAYISAVPTVSNDGNTLIITLADNLKKDSGKPFSGPPARVKLELRKDLIPGLDINAVKPGSTLETVVRPGSTNVQLVAKRMKIGATDSAGIFSISVDGYDRAFVFNTQFTGTNPTANKTKMVGIDCPEYAIPGKPLAARLEVYNDQPTDTFKPKLTFQRATSGDPEELTADLPTPRDQQLTIRFGPKGEVILASRVQDWMIPIDSNGVYGERKLEFTLDGATGVKAAGTGEENKATRSIIFDDTAPTLGELQAILPPVTLYGEALEKAKKAKPKPPALVALSEDDLVVAEKNKFLFVIASLADQESGLDLDSVRFWIGAPPGADGKAPPNGALAKPEPFVPAKLDPKTGAVIAGETNYTQQSGTYFAKFRLPDTKGKVKVGVIFANRAGIKGERTAEVMVVDPPEEPAKPTTGTIEVRVIQGSSPERPQPGLTVTLFDAAGAVVKAAATNEKGEVKFTELKPGSYFVYSVKSTDANAKDTQPGSVTAGKTTKVGLELKR